ncbi:hypothetical protein LEL_03258 [Akanthomyces lecanii RCEF 1005]|uniref:2EXR domain-containing protein n=1 Tax=Akanthomyces lecanii RCEF 1005 TaxID=1081108 RepID=A0A162K9S0_CORDF|nr:hypothetical protein LEL_03258 [Akanthomyces lecanii RCEF 1005]
MATALFTVFPRLPVEIRLQIWHLALVPEPPGLILFCLKKGCWLPRRLSAADPHFDPAHDDMNLAVEFRHELLNKAEFSVSLAFVSHEARRVAWAYVASQNLRYTDSVSGVFQRGYDATRDVLFAPTTGILHELLTESSKRLFEPDLLMRGVDCPCPEIFRLAITRDGLAWLAALHFCELWDPFLALETLYVMVNVPKDIQTRRAGRRWEIVSAHDTAYMWDASARQMVWRGEHSIDGLLGQLFAQMESCTAGLDEKLVEMGRDRFEMRAVYAVER